jgi:hypothetical protein
MRRRPKPVLISKVIPKDFNNSKNNRQKTPQEFEQLTISLRSQLIRRPRILHPLPNLLCHKLTHQRIRLPINKNLLIIRHPEAEPRLCVHVLPEDLALLGRRVPDGLVAFEVHEAEAGGVDDFEDGGVAFADVFHCLIVDFGVVEGDCLAELEKLLLFCSPPLFRVFSKNRI